MDGTAQIYNQRQKEVNNNQTLLIKKHLNQTLQGRAGGEGDYIIIFR